MSRPPDDRPVVGYFEDETGAEEAARRIRAGGLPAATSGGSAVAGSRFGRHLFRGFVAGLLIAIPFAIGVPLLAWSRNHAGIDPVSAIGLLGVPILFVGVFLGVTFQAARHEMSRRARARLVVTEPIRTSPTADKAATDIERSGGEVVEAPTTKRSRLAG